MRAKPNVLIVATRHGLIMANAGIDQSNLDAADHGRRVLLLPEEPDASAQRLKDRLDAHFKADIGVIVSDSAGRAWRLGTVGIAIGAAGVPSLWDRRGEKDLSGRPLEVTEVALPTRWPPWRCWPWARRPRGDPRHWCAGSTGRAEAAPAAALVRPKARGPVPMSRGSCAGSYVALSGGSRWGQARRRAWRSCCGERLAVIVNTGDDFEHLGLHISPDVDTALYTLAGLVNDETGWGRRGETWTFMRALRRARRADMVQAGRR